MDEESIFLQAVAIESHDARAAFLDRACAGDVPLRNSLESLLNHHRQAGRFLEIPPVELQQTLAPWQGDTVNAGRRDRSLELLTPSTKPDCIGELGPYEILAVVGRGGMGVVLRARDSKLQRVVAIKLMNESAASSEMGKARFLREAQAAAAVKHDHVVTIHSVHDEGPVPYLVMEYIEGDSLESRLDNGQPLDAREVARIGLQIALGLAAAHQRGLVHRDIKPANILMEAETQRVKITDFGLARALDDGRLTRVGELAGTPQYMSPEQARGLRADQRSDFFSLGSVMYTLCTGRTAFPADSAVAALRAICDDRPPPIRELNKQIPTWLEALVNDMLDKDPSRRPQNAMDIIESLRAGLASPPQVQTSLDKSPPRNHRLLGALLGGAALVCAGIILYVNRDGKTTRVEVPDGAQVVVTKEGVVKIDLPGERAAPAPSLPMVPPSVRDIAAQLVKLNPDFDGQLEPTLNGDAVVALRLTVDQVKDVSPLKTLTTLRNLSCTGSTMGSGQLADLSPLSGLKLQVLNVSNTQVSNLAPLKGMPLESLSCANTKVADLAPLAGMPLAHLQLQWTQVTSLTPLRDSPLVDLNICGTRVTDLAPVRNMKLDSFYCDATRIADLSPLTGMPLKNLNWRGYDQTNPRHQQVVKSLETLESIDSVPTQEFWREVEAKQINATP